MSRSSEARCESRPFWICAWRLRERAFGPPSPTAVVAESRRCDCRLPPAVSSRSDIRRCARLRVRWGGRQRRMIAHGSRPVEAYTRTSMAETPPKRRAKPKRASRACSARSRRAARSASAGRVASCGQRAAAARNGAAAKPRRATATARPPSRARRRSAAQRHAAPAARRSRPASPPLHAHARRRRAAAASRSARRPAPSSSRPRSAPPASWRRSASRSAVRCSSGRSTGSRGRTGPLARGIEVADHPVRQRGEPRRRRLDRERAVGEHRRAAAPTTPARCAPRARRRPAPRGARRRRPSSTRASKTRSPSRVGRLPADQARRVTGRVDDHRPLVAERVGGRRSGSRPARPRRRALGSAKSRTRRRRRRRAPAAGSGARPRGSCARTGTAPITTGPAARAIASSSIARESAISVGLRSRCGRTGASPEASAAKIDGRSVAPSSERARSSAAGTESPRLR